MFISDGCGKWWVKSYLFRRVFVGVICFACLKGVGEGFRGEKER